ncbi:sensor histidine kinase [Noviherbaspirillum sp. UKPF54]|uniref:sensor histidine kinase n=1 Tax=Noviherbaspirillum sp. UKPF54 TaxID=2601898 RepID=UPI0011B10BD9|nr:sensor histidine kinase [Noviherbaspirillum sp. UKPF54]QDZ27351.1 sensor histidine kinase [Noviherbaspirillum sp. UKPF54]
MLGICLVVTALAWRDVEEGRLRDEQAYFEGQSSNMTLRIEQALSSFEQALQSAAAVAANQEGARSRLRDHVAASSSGMQEIAFIPAAESTRAAAPNLPSSGLPSVKIAYIPAGHSGSEAVAMPDELRSHALAAASPTSTAAGRQNAPLDHPQQVTLLMYLPVHAEEESRRLDHSSGKLLGYVYTHIRLSDFFDSLCNDAQRHFRIKFFKEYGASPEALLYENAPALTALGAARFSKTAVIDTNGNRWTIEFEASRPGLPYSDTRRPQIYILGGGLMLALSMLATIRANNRLRRAPPVEQTQQDLKNQIHALEARRDQEQKRLAQEMHDDLGQLLAAMKMDLACLSLHIPAGDMKASQHLAGITELVNTMMTSVRRIISDLPPQALDELGLFDALRLMAKKFEERHQVRCRVNLPACELHISQQATSAIYRMTQESLNNVAKHACATKVEIKMVTFDNRLELSIADNGKGFSARALQKAGSFGLIAMRERAASLNGSLRVESTSGAGTTIYITLPLDEKLQHSTHSDNSHSDKSTMLVEGI